MSPLFGKSIEFKRGQYAVLCVDIIIEDDAGNILLQQFGAPPVVNKWGLTGGYIEVADDNVEAAAIRNVKEELDMDVELTHLVDVRGNPHEHPPADPDFFAVQVIYVARPRGSKDHFKAPSHAVKQAAWMTPRRALFKSLAYNHRQLIRTYMQAKKHHALIPIARRQYDEYYGKEFVYDMPDYVHTVVKAIILNDKHEILLGYREQKPFKHHWDLPGGHMYVHESVTECLSREISEELGTACTVGKLFHVYSDKGMNPRFARAMVLYFVKLKSDTFVKNVELSDFQFFPLDQIPETLAYHSEVAVRDVAEYLASKQ